MEPVVYPFHLKHDVFSELVFRRKPSVPDQLQIQLRARVRLHAENLPDQMEIQLRLETIEDTPFTFSVELIAVFDVIAEDEEVNRDMAQRFVDERGFYMLFPLVRQKIGEIAYSMGIRRFQLPMMTFDHFSQEDPSLLSETNADQKNETES